MITKATWYVYHQTFPWSFATSPHPLHILLHAFLAQPLSVPYDPPGRPIQMDGSRDTLPIYNNGISGRNTHPRRHENSSENPHKTRLAALAQPLRPQHPNPAAHLPRRSRFSRPIHVLHHRRRPYPALLVFAPVSKPLWYSLPLPLFNLRQRYMSSNGTSQANNH